MINTTYRPHQIHPTVYVAQGVVIVGDVTLAAMASVWFNAVLRGDTEAISVGEGANIQDLCMLHADPGVPAVVGAGVTVGHRAIIHGAKVGDNSVVGMGAILLNGVIVGENSIVGANALLTQVKVFPLGSLILGSPAQFIRPLTLGEIEENRRSAERYVEKAHAFKQDRR